MGALIAIVVVVMIFLALVKAIVFTDTLNEVCLLLLAIAIIISAFPASWLHR